MANIVFLRKTLTLHAIHISFVTFLMCSFNFKLSSCYEKDIPCTMEGLFQLSQIIEISSLCRKKVNYIRFSVIKATIFL